MKKNRLRPDLFRHCYGRMLLYIAMERMSDVHDMMNSFNPDPSAVSRSPA